MRCLVCSAEMQVRGGRYGPFYYCPRGRHGTLSVAKYEELVARLSGALQSTSAGGDLDPLMLAVERETLTLGGGLMPDTERFFVDCEASYEDPDGFWQNVRPY